MHKREHSRNPHIPKMKDMSEVVDPSFYLKAYVDLKAGQNPVSHYEHFGKAEGRLPSYEKFMSLYPTFNASEYLTRNPDLKRLNLPALVSHYHHHGKAEGRWDASTSIASSLKSTEDNITPILPDPIPIIDYAPLAIQPHDISRKYLRKAHRYVDEDGFRSIQWTSQATQPANFDNNKLYSVLVNVLNTLRDDAKPIYLIMAEWGGNPPFGGGECWLNDTAQWQIQDGYHSIYMYFTDHKTGKHFKTPKVAIVNQIIYIQMPSCDHQVIGFLRRLQPKPTVISHQGFNRLKFLRWAQLTEIPIITGFCFWGDIIKSPKSSANTRVFNQDMLKHIGELQPDPNFQTILQQFNGVYACGQFLNQVVKAVHGVELPVINTISNCLGLSPTQGQCDRKYVTIVNIAKLKGGAILESIIAQTSLHIPFILINSQEKDSELSQRLKQIIETRNQNASPQLQSQFINEHIADMTVIYKQTQILLIPSLVDETFCRVAYEGMTHRIPILSTRCGNLPYLLKDYADFLDHRPDSWSRRINELYDSTETLYEMSHRQPTLTPEQSRQQFINFVNEIKTRFNDDDSQKLEPVPVGIFCPWGDQGLGIQCREYYHMLKTLTNPSYLPCVFSFKPYHATAENPRLQTNPKEWQFPNVFYSQYHREDIPIAEIMDFIRHYRIKKFILVETCFAKIFEIATTCKLLGVTTYGIPNLETVRSHEVQLHNYFDWILCNNQMTYEIFSGFFPEKTKLIRFHMLNPNLRIPQRKMLLLNDNIKTQSPHIPPKPQNPLKPSFFCCGGLNALSRKNIDKAIQAFRELEIEKRLKTKSGGEFKLYIYIQGVELLPPYLQKLASLNIIISQSNRSYAEICELYRKHTHFIHLGSREGLGLGFYEAIKSGCPIITQNTPPNNEIIHDGVNGWLVPCSYNKLADNHSGITLNANVSINDVKLVLAKCIETYNPQDILKRIIDDNQKRFSLESFKTSFSEALIIV
jgi:glycosyltransferase involved in cell wall biosynthesis